jgi:phytanoyl-CoA hydroxylase
MSQFEYFGHLGDVQDPLNFFLRENYLVCRGATDIQQIDDLLEFYNQSIVVPDKLYLRQSSAWEYHQKSPVNGIINAFLQPHCFEEGLPAHFSDKILRALSFRGIQEALSEISGKPEDFQLVQTMFFDHSVTRPHQDWIYLDSRPNGHLIAAWVALEDIYPEGIRFFVYPGTHNFYPKSSYDSANKESCEIFYGEFLAEIDRLLESDDYIMYAPPLKKGDVFFWGSRIIHGSTPGTNPDLRRRSIAAHFLPNGFGFGDLEADFNYESKEKYGLSYVYSGLDRSFQRLNNPMYRAYDSLRKSLGKL